MAELRDELVEMYRLIRRFEGCRLMPYYCPAGVLTCGWGSTGWGIVPGRPWTQAQADERMEQDAKRFALATLKLCPGLRGARLSAIADFAYNLGAARLAGSTLRRRVNAGDWPAARAELAKWVNAGGRKLRGLVVRRAAEAALLVD